ncbi:Uncharacterized protein FWK35_00035921, partial [Aphis craccivora]
YLNLKISEIIIIFHADFHGSFQKVKKIDTHKASNLPLKKLDGTFTSSDFDKTTLGYCRYRKHKCDEDMKMTFNALFQPEISVKSFSPKDIKYLIHKYLHNKPPGLDFITAEVRRNLPKGH